MKKVKRLRETLKKGFSFDAVKEMLQSYAPDKMIRVESQYNWNHAIEFFYLHRTSGELFIDIYWQGNSTDGHCDVAAREFRFNNTVIVPAEYFHEGNRIRTVHSDLRIERKEFESTVPSLLEWLSDEKFQERDLYVRKKAAYEKVYTFAKEKVFDTLARRYGDPYRKIFPESYKLTAALREDSLRLVELLSDEEKLRSEIISMYQQLR